MRTTLSIDDDILDAARVLARQRRTSVGAVISALVRQSLAPPATKEARSPTERHGLPLLPWREDGGPVDLDLVNQLRDDQL
jgi:hypothetical protein